MKVIIAGSRGITDSAHLERAVKESGFNITEVVSGTARGVDQMGEQWAMNNKKTLRRMPAKWDVYGKSAGYRRNEDMAKYADAVIILWDGESKGTKHMMDLARRYGLDMYVLIVNE